MVHTTRETTRNINQTFSLGSVNKCTVQHWFKKFCNGDKNHTAEEGCKMSFCDWHK